MCFNILSELKDEFWGIERIYVVLGSNEINSNNKNRILYGCDYLYFPKKCLPSKSPSVVQRNKALTQISDIGVVYYANEGLIKVQKY